MRSPSIPILVAAASVALAMTGCNLFSRLPTPAQPEAPMAAVQAVPPATTVQPATDIYQQVAPSVVYIETDWATGSGFIVEIDDKKYVVTNSHVVSPFRVARVVLPDGNEMLDVPVVDIDLLADLAVIGPVETDARPLNLSPKTHAAIGSPVYLIGYPGESETFPQPTLATGLLSNIRHWAAADLTYYQTDASTVGGQSGGVLVAADGEVLGVPTFWFGEPGAFGLALDITDALPRIGQMVAGQDSDGLGERGTILDDTDDMQPVEIGETLTGALDYYGDTDIFTIELARGDTVDIAVDSIHIDPIVLVGDETATEATLINDDDSGRGVFGTDALLTYEAETGGTHIIMIQDINGNPGAYLLTVTEGEPD